MRINFYQKPTSYLSAIALLVLALSFTACKKENAGTSYIQFTNASELTSPIDFYVADAKKNTATLAYNESTNYFSVSSKEQPAVVKVPSSGEVPASFNITPKPNAYYSVFYFTGGGILAYEDDLTAPATGKARVRFINLNVGVSDDNDFGIAGGAKLASNLPGKFDSDYYDVAPGATFSAYVAGSSTVLLNIPTSIQAGHIYTIYLSGQTQDSLKATVLMQK